MRILLTGGNGFIGRHVVSALSGLGHDIYHLTRKLQGNRDEFLWNFLDPLPADLPQCDVIIHLAAFVYFGTEMLVEQYNINVISATRLALCAKQQHARLILASASGVHGFSGTIGPSSPLRIDNHYMMSKFLAEQTATILTKDLRILRIGGVYGIDGPAHLGLNGAITRAFRQGSPPTLKGSGKPKRNYICVEDVARWMASIATDPADHAAHQTLYLASPEILSVREYLAIICEELLDDPLAFKSESGVDSPDMIVTPSEAPHILTTFREYIKSLRGQSDRY